MLHTKICTLIKETLGLEITSIGQSTLERAVNHRLQALQLTSQEKYWHILQSSKKELENLVEEVVIPETWLFRDKHYFATLTNLVHSNHWKLPSVFRVLSVPCATGEEPYSLAIALLSAGIPPKQLHIDAVDISSKAIARAKKGTFRKRSFRNNDPLLQKNFFIKTDEGYSIVNRVREVVTFHNGNILSSSFIEKLGSFDVIFCKNLLIYLNRSASEKVIHTLNQAMAKNGVLFVGPAEVSLYLDAGFNLLARETPYVFSKEPLQPQISRIKSPKDFSSPPPPKDQLVTGQETTSKDVLLKARKFADLGQLQDAKKLLLCKSIEPSASFLYLSGIIADFEGNTREAVILLKKALYYDPNHEESLAILGLLLKRLGDTTGAAYYKERLTRLRQDQED